MLPKDIERVIREWTAAHPQFALQLPLESRPEAHEGGLLSVSLFHIRARRVLIEFDELFLLVLWGLDQAKVEGEQLHLRGFNSCLYDTGSNRSEARWFKSGQVTLHGTASPALAKK